MNVCGILNCHDCDLGDLKKDPKVEVIISAGICVHPPRLQQSTSTIPVLGASSHVPHGRQPAPAGPPGISSLLYILGGTEWNFLKTFQVDFFLHTEVPGNSLQSHCCSVDS